MPYPMSSRGREAFASTKPHDIKCATNIADYCGCVGDTIDHAQEFSLHVQSSDKSTTNSFPDKARLGRSKYVSGIPPLGPTKSVSFHGSSSRDQQRQKSFQWMAARRNSSFTSGTWEAVSGDSKCRPEAENDESIAPVRSLKVFVGIPSAGFFKSDDLQSGEIMEMFSKVAAADENDVSDNRPLSPRPESKSQAIVIHSEVLSNWEDSIRFTARYAGKSFPAACTYKRIGTNKDAPLPMECMNIEESMDGFEMGGFL